MDIKQIVKNIQNKYKTDSVYDIIRAMNIEIHKDALGSIRGYYCKKFRVKQIYINDCLSEQDEKFVLSHELGHAILHPEVNTPFLKANTHLSIAKMEIEANKFAMELLLSDDELNEYRDYTIEQISRIFGYHQRLIELRVK